MDKIADTQTEYWKNETVAFLALTSIKGVSYWTLRKIAESKIGFKELLKANDSKQLKSFLRVGLSADEDWLDVQQGLWSQGIIKARELAKKGIKLVFMDHPSFPDSLRRIPEPPYWIFVQGSLDNLNKKSVAIVGTRAPTDDGIFLAKLVIAGMVGKNIPTVSGLASGIDQIAHIESIRFGIPTIAVLGNGILREYPKGSNLLKEQIIAQGGTVLTEYLPEQSYSAENFVRRNRIQAALCDTLIPVQWKMKSGTAHTVEYSYKYGKKIVNLYLPLTYELRPELEFSEKNRAAVNFEVPSELQNAFEYIFDGRLKSNEPPKQQSFDL